jgi:hypothetical protein
MSFEQKMFDFGAVQCSLCEIITPGTMNGVPERGLTINPYMWGGYYEFTDNLWITEDKNRYSDIHLCHDCSVKLFTFLKVKPEHGHHPSDIPNTVCCDWGYDPENPENL